MSSENSWSRKIYSLCCCSRVREVTCRFSWILHNIFKAVSTPITLVRSNFGKSLTWLCFRNFLPILLTLIDRFGNNKFIPSRYLIQIFQMFGIFLISPPPQVLIPGQPQTNWRAPSRGLMQNVWVFSSPRAEFNHVSAARAAFCKAVLIFEQFNLRTSEGLNGWPGRKRNMADPQRKRLIYVNCELPTVCILMDNSLTQSTEYHRSSLAFGLGRLDSFVYVTYSIDLHTKNVM